MSKELDYIADLEKENRLLGERCNQLLKDKGDLTDHCQRLIDQYSELFATKEQLSQDNSYLKTKIKSLEEQIADIKANCDLAIEGRDIKIKELEQELTVQKDQLQEETNLHLHAEDYIKELEQKLEQTEKDLIDYQFNYPSIKELKKENAELNRQLEEADNATDCFNRQEEIIEQAKDHIKTLLDCLKQDTNDPQTNYYVCQYMDKAEQFLKDVPET